MVGDLVGRGVRVGVKDGVGQRVLVGSVVRVGVMLGVEVALGKGVGGSPVMMNCPETLHLTPTNIWISYSPGVHWSGGGSQSV